MDYVAGKIGLPKPEVEKKLSQMILDKKFLGILDQETGVLVIFTSESRWVLSAGPAQQMTDLYFFRDKTFDDVIDAVSAMNAVVDRLYQSAKKLTWSNIRIHRNKTLPNILITEWLNLSDMFDKFQVKKYQ